MKIIRSTCPDSGSCRGTTYRSGPNLAAFNSTREHARADIAKQQYAVIAPTLHCSYTRATEDTKVGERGMGDARLDYSAMQYGWFDHFLKGEDNHVLETMPKVKYFVMGANKWETSDTWPPKGATPKTFYLSSAGKANTLEGRWHARRRSSERR